MDIVHASFKKSVSGKPKSNVKKPFKEALETQNSFAKSSQDFLKRLGITEVGVENGVMFMNGKLIEFNEDRVRFYNQSGLPCINYANIALGACLDANFN